MVRLAGGEDVLGREGEASARVTWEQMVEAKPDVVLLMACGYNLARNVEAWSATSVPAGWSDLPAVQSRRVFAVDANSYFSRPGPRLAAGVKLLAGLLHPQIAKSGDVVAAASSRVQSSRKNVSELAG
jgi:iron complex transport system substrate-binding protein